MQLLIAISIFAVILCYIYLLIRRSDVALMGVLGVHLLGLTVGDPIRVIGGLHISLGDLVYMCTLAAGVIRAVQRIKVITPPRVLAICYLSLFALSLFRGLSTYGIATASNASRSFLGSLLAFLYFLDVDVDDWAIKRYIKIYLAFGGALCLIALLAYAGLPVGGAAIAIARGGVPDPRVLPASSAAAICIAGVMSLAVYQYRKHGMVAQCLPIIFFAFAIYLRHRTVWVMMLACFLAMPLVDSRLFRRVIPAALVAAVVVGGLAVYGTTHREGVDEADFAQSATNTGTWEWRVNGWVELFFDSEQTPLTVVAGKSMGGDFWRIDPETHLAITVAPHDEFLTEYLRVGLIGALCILLFTLQPLWGLRSSLRRDPLSAYPSVSMWILVVVALVAYGVPYALEPHQYALVGIANALVSRRGRANGSEWSEMEPGEAGLNTLSNTGSAVK